MTFIFIIKLVFVLIILVGMVFLLTLITSLSGHDSHKDDIDNENLKREMESDRHVISSDSFFYDFLTRSLRRDRRKNRDQQRVSHRRSSL